MITSYIELICNILNISVPAVSYDTSHFVSKTMLAQCSSDGKTIYIKKQKELNPDLFLSIAHELRHVWQIRTDYDLYLSNYKSVDQCHTYEEYNLQLAEIDANAFASVMMANCFNLTPQWKGLPDKVIEAINSRIHTITE